MTLRSIDKSSQTNVLFVFVYKQVLIKQGKETLHRPQESRDKDRNLMVMMMMINQFNNPSHRREETTKYGYESYLRRLPQSSKVF